jgi:cytoskeletal protein CcmA (bactofilin family)
MFSKTKADAAAEPPPRKLAPASLVADGVRLTGNLETTGDLHFDGTLEGDVRVGLLVIGETGCINGSIHADTVEIRGQVKGVICARKVKLWASARVDADISHTELAIDAGAHFEGRSLALTPPPAQEQPALEAPPPALSVAAE